MTEQYDPKTSETLLQKVGLIKSFVGTDLTVGLTALTYAICEVAIVNNVEFRSIIKNVALIWEHVESQFEEEDEGEADAGN